MDQPLIGPEPVYPTPWRTAERVTRDSEDVVVTASSGHQALVAPYPVADLIVMLVNWFADSGLTLKDLKNSQAQANGVWIRKEEV